MFRLSENVLPVVAFQRHALTAAAQTLGVLHGALRFVGISPSARPHGILHALDLGSTNPHLMRNLISKPMRSTFSSREGHDEFVRVKGQDACSTELVIHLHSGKYAHCSPFSY